METEKTIHHRERKEKRDGWWVVFLPKEKKYKDLFSLVCMCMCDSVDVAIVNSSFHLKMT